MKKIFAAILSLTMLAALASCGEGGTTTSSTAPASSAAPVVSVAPAVSVPVIEIPSEPPVPAGPANLALDATITDCEKPVYDGAHFAANLNDGNKAAPGWQITNGDFASGDWALFTFEEAASIDTIVIYCEDGTTPALDDGLSIYVSADGENFDKLKDATVESNTTEEYRADTIALAEAVEAKAVKVVLDSKKSGKDYAPHIYEVEIYEATEEEEPAETDEAAESDAAVESEAE